AGAFMRDLRKRAILPLAAVLNLTALANAKSRRRKSMVKFVVNGAPAVSEQPSDTPLLWVIRDELGLTGTKYGCGIAQCGACTVHLDGQTLRSCSAPVSAVAGRQVTTIEGLSSRAAKAVQKAWVDLDVVQCGYCQSGQ